MEAATKSISYTKLYIYGLGSIYLDLCNCYNGSVN
jgi:hypothetical protein